MTTSGNQPNKRAIIDALVLAFSYSDVREVVGTDALRSVLEVEYRELISGTEFNIQPLWDLLSEQPGFVANDAIPPVCVFASWASRLNISVALPQEIDELDPAECNQRARECQVPSAELEEVLDPTAPQPSPSPKASAAPPPTSPSVEWSPSSKEPAKQRPWIGPVAGAVALVCFGFAALQLLQFCDKTPDWKPVIASGFAGDLPITKPRRLGNQVGVVLTDPNWVSLPEAEKRQQLEKALFALDDARVLFVEDKTGKVRATVQVSPSTQQLHFSFY